MALGLRLALNLLGIMFGSGGPGPGESGFLLEDNMSFLLLEDGSFLLLEA